MFAQFYERQRSTGLEKPMLEKILMLKQDAGEKGKAIKTLFLTDDEFESLNKDFTKLKEEIKAAKNTKENSAIEAFLGLRLEIVNEIGRDSIDKVA